MVSTIGIISLSSGIIGEDFVKHEVDLGIQRLKDLGLNPIFLPHSLKGLDFIKEHPEAFVLTVVAVHNGAVPETVTPEEEESEEAK